MREIRDQLIKAQMKLIDIESKDWCGEINFTDLKKSY